MQDERDVASHRSPHGVREVGLTVGIVQVQRWACWPKPQDKGGHCPHEEGHHKSAICAPEGSPGRRLLVPSLPAVTFRNCGKKEQPEPEAVPAQLEGSVWGKPGLCCDSAGWKRNDCSVTVTECVELWP